MDQTVIGRTSYGYSGYCWHCNLLATMRTLTHILILLLSMTKFADATSAQSSGVELLQRAFDRRFNFDLVQVVELRSTSSSGELRRTIEMATKRIGRDLHGLGHFAAPVELRGMRILMIERHDRDDDFFLYLPAQGKVRRVSSAQRADVFMGTDLTYEDFERRYVHDYEVAMVGMEMIQNENAYAIRCKPRYDSGHSYAVYVVAESDQAILEVRYYRGDSNPPFKIQKVPRALMMNHGEFIVPTRMSVENRNSGTATEVRFSQIRINPEVDDSLFTRSALEIGRPIPFLIR